GLPPEVTEAIALHHGGPNGLVVPSREAACVQVANSVADLLVGAEIDPDLLDLAMDGIGLTSSALDSLALHAGAPLRAMSTSGSTRSRTPRGSTTSPASRPAAGGSPPCTRISRTSASARSCWSPWTA